MTASAGTSLPRTIDHLDARFAFAYEPVHYTVDIGHVSLRGRDPDIALNDLSGRISERDSNLFLDRVAIRTAESSLKINGEVTYNFPGRIAFPKVPDNLIAKPTLVWLLQHDAAATRQLEASYLTEGIGWRADYVLSLAGEAELADFASLVARADSATAPPR